jgi:drug/metabolite transporter (DMT)-like permease
VLPSANGVGQGSFFGNAMAVVSGVFLAAYLMCGTYSMQKVSLGGYATAAYGTCFLVTLIVVLIFGVSVSFDLNILLICLALAVAATLIGHSLFNWSLPYVGAFFVTVVLLGEPVGASIVAYFMFGTVPGWVELLGGAMVIAGIAIMVMRANRRGKQT